MNKWLLIGCGAVVGIFAASLSFAIFWDEEKVSIGSAIGLILLIMVFAIGIGVLLNKFKDR